jgi:LysM repeat protein
MKLKDLTINRSLTAKFLGTRSGAVVGIILHDTAGSGTHNDTKYLSNPGDGRRVSVDFTVERDGSIWQLNPDLVKKATFHAGRATSFKGLKNREVTLRALGIEIVQKANLSLSPTYTPAQLKAVAQLCAALCGEFKLAAADISTHAAVITDGSRTDPRRFDFDTFWLEFREAVGQGDTAEAAHEMTKISEPVSATETTYNVKSGDTLTKIAKKFKVTIKAIKTRNNLKSDLILVGQSLVIP